MQLKRLAVPVYLVAFILVFVPLLDTLLSVWPLQLGEVPWRFGAVGLFSRALMTPLLGLLLALAVGMLLDHRWAVRGVAVLSAIAAFAIVGVVVMFVLDAVQMRAQVRPEAKTSFDVASAVALGKYGLGAVVFTAFSWCGWRAAPRVARRAERRTPVAAPVVARQTAS